MVNYKNRNINIGKRKDKILGRSRLGLNRDFGYDLRERNKQHDRPRGLNQERLSIHSRKKNTNNQMTVWEHRKNTGVPSEVRLQSKFNSFTDFVYPGAYSNWRRLRIKKFYGRPFKRAGKPSLWFKLPWYQRSKSYYNFKPFFTVLHASRQKNVFDVLSSPFKRRKWLFKFRIDLKKQKFKRMSVFLKNKIKLLRMRLFYGIYNRRKYVRLLRNKGKADTHQSFLFTLMERRLDVILYRCGFCSSILTAQQVVRHGGVLVEGKLVRNFYYPIKFFEKVTFSSPELTARMQYNYIIQLRLKRLRALPLRYLIVNFLFMYCYIRPIREAREEVPLSWGLRSRYLSIR
jgi:hypothetical protein